MKEFWTLLNPSAPGLVLGELKKVYTLGPAVSRWIQGSLQSTDLAVLTYLVLPAHQVLFGELSRS